MTLLVSDGPFAGVIGRFEKGEILELLDLGSLLIPRCHPSDLRKKVRQLQIQVWTSLELMED